MGHVYEDCECPQCGDVINEYGFCESCGCDWVDWVMEN